MDSLIYLFTDGSVNTATKVGVGAFLIVSEIDLSKVDSENIITKRFTNTSSTKLELQILIFGLQQLKPNCDVEVFTDSQTIINLPNRRIKLEGSNYVANSGKLLNNADLYKTLFQLFDKLNITLTKVAGHSKASQKAEIDKLFQLVDKASRKQLRYYNEQG